MTEETKAPEKNIILFIGKATTTMINAVRSGEKALERKYRIALLYDTKTKFEDGHEELLKKIDLPLGCDTNSATSLQKMLLPYEDQIVAVTCRGEDQIPLLARVAPHLPYLLAPTSESLAWATDKILMRRRLRAYDKSIAPAFTVVSNATMTSVKKIEEKVGFPLVVKPAGLAASRLVTICFHKEELRRTLRKVFRRLRTVYKETGGRWEPQVLAEHFMEGDMYSIDGYVDAKGKIAFCPMVYIKTGRSIGFDDFFGYQQMTPTRLKKESVEAAETVATKAVHALALRSTTVHIELMRLEDGWKIIEVGPRIGGFRHVMYELSYGINHTMNDILNHMEEKPIIPKKVLGYSAALKFFAKEEGTLTKLTGVKKVQELQSFKEIDINKKIGDQCLYAKNGGSSVFNIILFNPDRSALLADIRRVEESIVIETE